MSNLHLLLDEANKHDPKGFDPANINTFPWKDELGLSTYRDQMELPPAINFVDGTVAAPTTVDGDTYVLIGAGVIDGSWGVATFGDWVKFTNSQANPLTPVAGSLCYDVAGASWMQYDGALWAAFGVSGGTSLYTADGTVGAGRVATLTDSLIFTGGKVGIGTNAPTETLHVGGDTLIDGDTTIDGGSAAGLLNVETANGALGAKIDMLDNTGIVGSIRTYGNAQTGNLQGAMQIQTHNANGGVLFRIATGGDVKHSFTGSTSDAGVNMKSNNTGLLLGSGIGATTVGAKLHVIGTSSLVGDSTITGDLHVQKTDSSAALIKVETANGALGAKIDMLDNTGIVGSIRTYGDAQTGNLQGAMQIQAHNANGGVLFRIATGGDVKHSFTGSTLDANVNMKSNNTGLLLGSGIGATTVGAKLHVIGTIRSDQTTVLSKTISTDFLPINVNGTVRWLALYD